MTDPNPDALDWLNTVLTMRDALEEAGLCGPDS